MFDTIMITGGSGLVGRNLLDNQDLHKYHILAPTHAELDLGDYPAVLDYISFCHPDLIVHAAGKVGGIMANLQDMYGFYMQNIFMGLNLVKAARESGVRYFLNLSSSCAYPCEAPNPLREEYILSGRFEPTNEGYAMAKLAVLKACQFTSDQHSAFQYKTLIPCNLYGIYDKFDPVSSHFMAAILMKLHDAKFQHQDRVEIWGDGTARRELMFTTDFAEIVAKCIDNFACLPLIMNVGTGVDYSINEYYATAARVMGVDVEFTHDLSKPGGMRQKLLDVSIQKQLGFNAISSLEEGIHQTYKYLLRVKGGGIAMQYELASSTWDEQEIAAIHAVISSGCYTMGRHVKQFEQDFARFTASNYCVMVNSGSSANLLAVASLFYKKDAPLQRGDEVIVPAVSWSTTYFPLCQYGLKIKFVDVDRDTLNFDMEQFKNAVSEHTRLIFAVNLMGNANDFEEIENIIRGRNIYLLEDNCESLGGEYKGRPLGSIGIMGTFSTFFSHHISTMEGGCVCTSDEEQYHILLSLRSHGWTRHLPQDNKICIKSDNAFEESFRFVLPGYNVRPLEISGAIGIEQLKKLPHFIKIRRQNAAYFKERFGGDQRFNIQKEIGRSSWFGFAMLINEQSGIRRADVIAALSEAGIETRPVVAGNFAKKEAVRYCDYTLYDELKNADYIDRYGFFVGNHQYDIRDKIDYLHGVLQQF